MSLRLDPDRTYRPGEIMSASGGDLEVDVSEETLTAVSQSRGALETLRDDGVDIYGATTGFGALVDYDSAGDRERQGRNLIYHLGVGTGSCFSEQLCRMALLIRALTVGRGYSGVRPSVFQQFVELIQRGPTPAVPRTGSVGASGDLVPMANAVLCFMGEGEVLDDRGTETAAKDWFRNHDMDPLELEDRDALGLVNGIPFCTALGVWTVEIGQRLLKRLLDLQGWLYGSLGCSPEALSDTLNRVKGHPHQRYVASELRERIDHDTRSPERPLQEPYSLRSVPQVLGAVRRQMVHTREIVSNELNGVDDNPITFDDDGSPAVQHGANFVGQNLAFAMDGLNEALTQVGNLVERQLAVLMDGDRNGPGTDMLAVEPGRDSGFAGAQLNATAIVSEMRKDCSTSAASSIPTNGDNQDLVPMAMEAGKATRRQTTRLSRLMAILARALHQYESVHGSRDRDRNSNMPEWMIDFTPMDTDRPLKNEIQRLAVRLRQADSSTSDNRTTVERDTVGID